MDKNKDGETDSVECGFQRQKVPFSRKPLGKKVVKFDENLLKVGQMVPIEKKISHEELARNKTIGNWRLGEKE